MFPKAIGKAGHSQQPSKPFLVYSSSCLYYDRDIFSKNKILQQVSYHPSVFPFILEKRSEFPLAFWPPVSLPDVWGIKQPCGSPKGCLPLLKHPQEDCAINLLGVTNIQHGFWNKSWIWCFIPNIHSTSSSRFNYFCTSSPPLHHLLTFALALHCLWAVTLNSMQEASYGYGLCNEKMWIRAGMLSTCSSRFMYFMNQDLVLFANVWLRNLCYANGACALMLAAGVQGLAAGVAGQLPAYNSIFLSVTWEERKKHVSDCLWHQNIKSSSLQGHLRLFYTMTYGKVQINQIMVQS